MVEEHLYLPRSVRPPNNDPVSGCGVRRLCIDACSAMHFYAASSQASLPPATALRKAPSNLRIAGALRCRRRSIPHKPGFPCSRVVRLWFIPRNLALQYLRTLSRSSFSLAIYVTALNESLPKRPFPYMISETAVSGVLLSMCFQKPNRQINF